MTIQEIIARRKKFVNDTYQFYSQHNELLSEITESIIEEIQEDLEQERKFWYKWQRKNLVLTNFNSEIKEWMHTQRDRPINTKRIIEISYLKTSFEKQAEEAKKHYLIFLSDLNKKRNTWKEEIAMYLVRTINQNSHHKQSKLIIDNDLEALREYCDQWKKSLIDQIHNIISESKDLQIFCAEITQEVESAQTVENSNILLQESLPTIKNTKLSSDCIQLSDQLQIFFSKYDFKNISQKLDMNYTELKDAFIDLFADSSMSGMRASLKIIKSLETTQEKVLHVQKKLAYIENVFYPHYKALKERREKMIQSCFFSQQLEQHTAFKWIDTNLSYIFASLDKNITQP